VLGNVGVELFLLLIDGLDQPPEFGAELGTLGLEVIIGAFKLRKGISLFAAVRIFDGSDFLFVLIEIFLFALLGGAAGFRLDVVGGGVDVGAAIGENALHREDFGADIAQLLIDFLDARRGALAGLVEGQFDILIFGGSLDIFLRGIGLRARSFQERGVAIFPFLLEGFPGALAEVFVPQRPEERSHEDDHGQDVVRRERFAYDRVVIGNGLIGHQFLLGGFPSQSRTGARLQIPHSCPLRA